MQAKKLLIITQNFYPELGSAANRLKLLFKHFNDEGVFTKVLTTKPSYPNHLLFKDDHLFNDEMLNNLEGEQIIRMNMWGSKQSKSHIFRLLYYLEQFIRVRAYINLHKGDFDYIYVSSPNIFLAWATLFLKRNKKAQYILEIRDLWPDSVKAIKGMNLKVTWPLLKWLEKKMYNKADKIVVNNLSFQNHIKKLLLKPIPIIFIPNSLSREERYDKEKLNEFSIIYTGNIGYAQDVNQLIEICTILNELKIKFTGIIYGVQAPKLREAVKSMKYIELQKALSREDCLKEISKHHVALSILNNREVFMNVIPGKIIDAIGVGTIPITNIGGVMMHDIQNFQMGYAKKQATTSEIINAIISYRDNRQKYEKERKNLESYRDENLIWEKNIHKLILFLRGE
ncbi:glycosyltransferase family 4 protein [Staphylococcus felis]|nr:glycosyltransferase family 4 protein [Staphylococcus felis]REH78030.1 glycosyltransferase WbuB [Staphylococcus felis]REI07557.1 glycosyltransferase WbuB [Staphylococcus felis]REI35081.1 glycosyltransferase WbuB [Staphylococcus felis]UXR86133.1 glycosyltransferase family 4 protein [Staphylococcus felis]